MNAFIDLAKYFIVEDNSNPWSGTSLEGYYKLNPRAKGLFGEKVVENILNDIYHWNIEPADNSKNLGYDCKINGVKTEIKFSTALEKNEKWKCKINHIGFEKDWDQIICACVNGDGNMRIVMFSKDNFPKELLSHQQGGKTSQNDDYTVDKQNSYKFLFHDNAAVLVE